ncbi:MAG: sugar ABC transporter substrate-binding protein [Alphaproteobacteria bacterium]|nr:sugar ABC transporter substrate-binding protein [Alphaproteobacteria bacterium]
MTREVPPPPKLSRRNFLSLTGATALAGLASDSAMSPRHARAQISGDITMIKGPHSADEARFEAMIIDDFKQVEPDINVEFTTYDWANMNAELTTGFASGNPADVLYLVDLVYPNYAAQGALHDMTALVDSPDWAGEKAQIPQFAWNLARQGGGTWGVPVLGAVYNIYINRDLLDAAGVLDTWNRSYEDMMEAAKKTTAGDVFGFSVRTRTGDFAFWDWLPYVHNAGADLLNDDWSACGLRGAENATQFLIDMHQAGVTPPVGAMSTQEQFDLFKAGKIAIHHNETPHIASLLADPPDFDWDVAFAPPGEVAQTVMGNFGILSIAEASPSKDAAWAFVKHWASGLQVGRFAEQVNLQVVREDIISSLYAGNPVMRKVQTEFVPRVVGIQPHPRILQILQSVWPVAEEAYRGDLSGEETIARMCDITDDILA